MLVDTERIVTLPKVDWTLRPTATSLGIALIFVVLCFRGCFAASDVR